MKESFLKGFISAVSAIGSYAFGGFDSLMQTMLFLTVIDFATGTICALLNGTFKAKLCGQGVGKKVLMYFVIAVSCVMNRNILTDIPLRETVVFFYIYTEAFSLLENVGTVVSYPNILKKALASLNNE